jgi:hypothetical protein
VLRKRASLTRVFDSVDASEATNASVRPSVFDRWSNVFRPPML